MSEESFWTIGFRKVRHKRAKRIYVLLDNYRNSKALKFLEENDLDRVVRFQSMEDVNKKILDIERTAKSTKINFDRSYFTPLQIIKKDVKNNTKG